MSIRRSLLLGFLLTLPAAATSAAQDFFPAPIGVRIPVPPTPIAGMGQTWLAYELHLSSFAPIPLTLSRIDVYPDHATTPIASWSGQELVRMRLWPAGSPDSTGALAAGGSDVVFVWLPLPLGSAPSSLRHVLTARVGTTALSMDATIAVTPPSDAPVFGPPLKGTGWVAAFGPAGPNGHQRSIVPIHGRAAVVQRYAIDFYRLYPDGHQFRGDTANKRDYYAYGAEVLAVADGVIAVAHDGQRENERPDAEVRTVPITLETVGGNYVMIDVGHGKYAFYAHLQTGSVRVKAGERVKRGQVIGLLGLSGNTPSPHLHLHLGDTLEPIGSEGLPWVFDSFDVVGECPAPSTLWGWPTSCRTSAPDARRREIPLAWKLIRFPG